MHFNSDSDSSRRYIITQHIDCGHVEGRRGRSFWIQRYDTAASKWTRELISLRDYNSSEGINEKARNKIISDSETFCLISHILKLADPTTTEGSADVNLPAENYTVCIHKTSWTPEVYKPPSPYTTLTWRC